MEHQAGGGKLVLFPVNRIAEDRCAFVVEVDADLMSAPGVEVAEDKGSFRGLITGEDLVIGDGGFSAWRIHHSHFLAIHWVAADVSEDGIFGWGGNAMTNGEVEFLHGRPLGKLGDKTLVGGVCFSYDEAAGGIFIEAVDDAGSLDPAYAGELSFAVMEEGVDQGAVGIPGCWMDYDSVFFVENEEVLVFEENFQGDVLGGGLGGDGFGYGYGNEIASFDRAARFGGFSI